MSVGSLLLGLSVSRLHVAMHMPAGAFDGHRFAGHHVLDAVVGAQFTQGQPAAAKVCAAQKSYTGFVADFSQVYLSAASPRPPREACAVEVPQPLNYVVF